MLKQVCLRLLTEKLLPKEPTLTILTKSRQAVPVSSAVLQALLNPLPNRIMSLTIR